MIAIYITATSVDLPPTKLDSGSSNAEALTALGQERKVVVQKLGEEPGKIADVVERALPNVFLLPSFGVRG